MAPTARRDMDEIWQFTCTQWSVEQADAYHAVIGDTLAGIASGSLPGRPVNDSRTIFKYPAGSHMIYYRITAKSLTALRVLHKSMDPGRRLPR